MQILFHDPLTCQPITEYDMHQFAWSIYCRTLGSWESEVWTLHLNFAGHYHVWKGGNWRKYKVTEDPLISLAHEMQKELPDHSMPQQTCGWPQSNPHSRYSIYRQGLAARAKWTASRPGSWGRRLQKNETTKQGRSHFASSACLIAWYYVAAFDSVENLAGRRGSQWWQRRWRFWRCCPRNWPCSIQAAKSCKFYMSNYMIHYFSSLHLSSRSIVQYCMCKLCLTGSVDGFSFEVLGAMAAPDTAPEAGEASHGKPKLDVARMHAAWHSIILNRLNNDLITLLHILHTAL